MVLLKTEQKLSGKWHLFWHNIYAKMAICRKETYKKDKKFVQDLYLNWTIMQLIKVTKQ